MTQPTPQFVRTTPTGNQLSAVPDAAPEVDPTGGFGYSPMAEENPDDILLNPAPVRPALSFVRQAHPLPKSKIPASKMTPEQAAAYRAAQQESKDKSLAWMGENPRSVDQIVDHWNTASPEHKKQGMSWYADANHAAKTIARDTGISPNQAAGLIANYSPQQHWAQNLRMASLAAKGKIIGGPKDPNDPSSEGFMASKSQADAAQRIMAGEDYKDVFRGKKIKAFGHLIEHGADTDANDPQVVVDRHALGVAHGGYADDGIYTHSNVSKPPRKDGSSPVYDEVSQMYKDAADHINANGGHEGTPVAPHQVQAATWLERQNRNAQGGYSNDNENNGRGAAQAKIAAGYTAKWNAHAAEHHPELVNKVPGTGFSAAVGQGGMSNPEQFQNVANFVRRAAGKPDPNCESCISLASESVKENFADEGKDLEDHKLIKEYAKSYIENGDVSDACTRHAHPEEYAHHSSATRKTATFDDWRYDEISDQFKTSNLDAKFACNCGEMFAPAGMHKCACGQTWNSFDIIPQNKTANSITRIVRPVKEHRERVLAKVAADYRGPNSTEQEPDGEVSAKISNEYSEGIKPLHDTALPFFTRTDHTKDDAPVVFEPEDHQLNPKKTASELPYVRVPANKLKELGQYDDPAFNLQDRPKDPQFASEHNPAPVTTRQVAPRKQAGGLDQIPFGPRHKSPVPQTSGPQWQNNPDSISQYVKTPNNEGTINFDTGRAHVYGPGAGARNNVLDDELAQSLPSHGLQNEIENQLATDQGKHHSESPGRHRAEGSKMAEFDEADFTLGWTHAENNGGLPKTASQSFLQGYVAALEEITADRAPGWDTVAPAFEKDPHPTSSDYQDRSEKNLEQETKEMRGDFVRHMDKNNEAGQSRGNGSFTDLSGWKTAELAREIAIRTVAAEAANPKG